MHEGHLTAHIGQYTLIKNNKNEVLLLERMRSKTWCLPGGRLDEGEEWDSALLREMKEELNLECDDPKPLAVNILKDSYQTKYCVYFEINCLDISTLKISEEHSDLGWFGLKDINSLNVEDEKVKKIIQDYLSAA